ncbi:UdgX family uracil-DNA binding protein [Amycolatopsis sp. SID8362]|uniref:UdgX family uracil-DNA binding protein n=1 Tax=Amycolatopsis sp. SID8362 TaxID=2690346 RepID=UPI001369C207|nr:UdgX family uracil-DNA binding protein [Amycolatopsis sp. SID8362]NBH09193.1 UdgX family uracil-DNA binding protein [Amycolatopsis sp. SID8362]NED45886.1 UdgX family uracil-DNA binding protein [Amycolatopsis sp. SID8362]
MPDSRGAEPPDTTDLARLRSAASGCHGCTLYQDATQTVFGEGSAGAKVLVVGEQPGDKEDVAGEPFVGPAGRLLDRAFEEAGLDRGSLYVTNAVKHFKFRREGKRRIHQKPGRTEVVACRPWLLAELRAVRPELVLLLGATAAQSLLGPKFRLTEHRGEPVEPPAELSELVPSAVATVHPSAVLRAPDRDEAYAAFVADLKAAGKLLG